MFVIVVNNDNTLKMFDATYSYFYQYTVGWYKHIIFQYLLFITIIERQKVLEVEPIEYHYKS